MTSDASGSANGEEEWRVKLTPQQYAVLREKGTEPPWSGEYVSMKADGTYCCAGCGSVLFDSSTKYDSGCGWPSFYEVADTGAVVLQPDHSHGMTRTEVLCAGCGGHLGHVFDDGPAPTGQRYCMNSVALQFKGRDDA